MSLDLEENLSSWTELLPLTLKPKIKNVVFFFLSALVSLGYYYDLDDSYDESDEEEVKAHLRRVMEQPPLKLDTSSEVLEQLYFNIQAQLKIMN